KTNSCKVSRLLLRRFARLLVWEAGESPSKEGVFRAIEITCRSIWTFCRHAIENHDAIVDLAHQPPPIRKPCCRLAFFVRCGKRCAASARRSSCRLSFGSRVELTCRNDFLSERFKTLIAVLMCCAGSHEARRR